MKEIIIIPHIGIGQLKLGMAPDELEKTLLQMKRQWSNSSNEAMQMATQTNAVKPVGNRAILFVRE